MKQLFLCGAAALVVLAAAAQINADIARPKSSPSPAKEGKIVLHTGLTVVPDANVYEARLQISQESRESCHVRAGHRRATVQIKELSAVSWRRDSGV